MQRNKRSQSDEQHWLDIRAQLLEGRYRPKPVKQVMIPKPGGGDRKLGIPTVLDRFIQQPSFKPYSRSGTKRKIIEGQQ